MITLHRMNNKEFVLNADHIKYIESTPDTLITLLGSGGKVMVLESIAEVMQKVAAYKRTCQAWPLTESVNDLIGTEERGL